MILLCDRELHLSSPLIFLKLKKKNRMLSVIQGFPQYFLWNSFLA